MPRIQDTLTPSHNPHTPSTRLVAADGDLGHLAETGLVGLLFLFAPFQRLLRKGVAAQPALAG